MAFVLTEEQQMLRDSAVAFAAEKLQQVRARLTSVLPSPSF